MLLPSILRTVVPQLAHQSGVRQDDQTYVPCLACAVPELTLAHLQFSVLGSGPTNSASPPQTRPMTLGSHFIVGSPQSSSGS